MHTEPTTAAGLLLSLANALPDPRCALGREAQRLASRLQNQRLSHGASDRGLQRRAADLTAVLLDAVDVSAPLEDDNLLCEEFDQ